MDKLDPADQIPPAPIPLFQEIPIRGEDPVLERIDEELQQLQKDQSIPYGENLGGGISGILKRFIHQCIRCVVYPVVVHQNAFNARTSTVLTMLRAMLGSALSQSAADQKQLEHFTRRIAELESQLSDARDEIAELRRQTLPDRTGEE